MGFVRIAWKNNIQEAYLPKTGIGGQIVAEILAQLCSDDSKQILLNLTWVITLWHESNLSICKGHINAHAHWISHLLLIWIESKAFLSGSLSQPFCFAFRQRFVSEQFIFFLFFFLGKTWIWCGCRRSFASWRRFWWRGWRRRWTIVEKIVTTIV